MGGGVQLLSYEETVRKKKWRGEKFLGWGKGLKRGGRHSGEKRVLEKKKRQQKTKKSHQTSLGGREN